MGQDNRTGGHRVLVIGGSRGSIAPLRGILGALPQDLPATVFVVVHLATAQPRPTLLIEGHTRLQVELAEDGLRFAPGKVYIAPADHHLALEDGVRHVYRGPRENGSRPSIDVLFRSAAVHHGARVVGVLLSGALHDGSLGLSAVARCGGVTVVQAPEDAIDAEMPSNALRAARVDHCLPALAIPALLEQILAQPIPESPPAPDDLRLEARVALLAREPDAPTIVTGEPVPVACPDCGGALSLVRHGPSYGFRCHIGHAYSPSAMLAQHGVVLERALWVAFRTLKERIALLSKLIEEARANGRSGVEGFQERVRELEHQAAAIHHAMAILNESGFELEPGVKGE